MSYKLYKNEYLERYNREKGWIDVRTKLQLLLAPNVPKLKAKGNVKGLYKALHYRKFKFFRYVGQLAALALGEIGTDEAIMALKRALSEEQDDDYGKALG